MLESPVSKCEKTPWTRAQRWFCFLLFLVMGILMLMSYNPSPQLLWPLNFWTTNSWSSQYDNNITTTPVSSMCEIKWQLEGKLQLSILGYCRHMEVQNGRLRVKRGPASSVDIKSSHNSYVQTASDDPSASEYIVAYPNHYHFTLDEPDRCQQESPFLVLMIPVAPHNREARDTIRNTWGKEMIVLGQVVSCYFLLGQSKEEGGTEPFKEQVLQESQRHHDILQSNFSDSYNNLTIKTMLMFEWLASHCPNTSYAMKVDSDMFLNVHNLVNMLLIAPQSLYMTGMVTRGALVLRDHNSKWFMPVSAFSESRYPPYALGMGYVFSMDLPKKILEASAHVKAVYIEDVYVGLCMRHLGIALTDPPHGGLFRTTVPYFQGSCYWTSVITTILQNSKELSKVWVSYQTQAQSGC